MGTLNLLNKFCCYYATEPVDNTMNEKVTRRFKRADELESIITDFRMGNDPADVRGIRQNKVEKLNDEIRTLTDAYKEALGI